MCERSAERMAPIEKETPKDDGFDLEVVDDEDALEILKDVEINGDEYKGKRLTAERLREAGLAPKYEVRIGDTVIWLSSAAYGLPEGRVAVVAYVKVKDKLVARSYYRSNSHGLWRYLPDYFVAKGEIAWYGKGWSESGITLPIGAQRVLAEITKEDAPILDVDEPHGVFAGTARSIVSGKKATFYSEIESQPRLLEGKFYPEQKRGKVLKVPPEQVQFKNPENAPDFTKRLEQWEQKTDLYGMVKIEVFPSKDGKLKFMFCRDESGRAWIGAIEDDSELGSTGLKRSWVEGGDLATPAYEHNTQTGGYGNPQKSQGSYVDMFEKYVSKIPVIQEYLKLRTEY